MDVFVLNCIPVLVVVLLFVGIQKRKDEDFLSLSDGKALKGFAALGVILHHLTQINTNYSQMWKGPINIWNEMGILFTGVFFFLSGYGLWSSFHKKKNYLDGFLKKRLPVVLIPFLVSNIIYTLVMGIPFGFFSHPILILTSLVGITLVNTNTWYLVEILLLYLAFYVLFKNCEEERAGKGMILVVTIMVCIGLFAGYDTTLYGNWFRGEWWYNTTFVFIFGLYFAKFKDTILPIISKNIGLLAFLWILVMALDVYVLIHFGYHYEPTIMIGLVCRVLTCTVQTINSMLFVCLLLGLVNSFHVGNKVLFFIGDISLELYVIHNLINLACSYVFHMQDTLFYVVVFGLSFVLAYPLHKLDQKLMRTLSVYKFVNVH